MKCAKQCVISFVNMLCAWSNKQNKTKLNVFVKSKLQYTASNQ